MPGPSDIRVNPFNNATNYVNLTERHIVPSVSPFVVRLNEVPEKQDPSNMQMYYVDDTTGQTTETALTEVAATPGAGEFRPDYSTNAFDDTSWNTGLIEFSSADAGKIIEVSYTATGTLAGVKTNRYPAWWLDRGDGSDGDFAPESNVTISGEKNYTSVFIKSGVTVTANGYSLIKCQGAVVNKGTITADGTGAKGGVGNDSNENGLPGENGTSGGNGGAGGSYNGAPGGAGGNGSFFIGTTTAESVIAAVMSMRGYAIGAGGGSGAYYYQNTADGGNGGGSIVIVCKELNNTGNITADGNDGEDSKYANYLSGGGGGGGAGGAVIIIANRIKNTGNISATGGAGGKGSNGTDGADAGDGITYIKELGEM